MPASQARMIVETSDALIDWVIICNVMWNSTVTITVESNAN